jgi:hypothetical protein
LRLPPRPSRSSSCAPAPGTSGWLLPSWLAGTSSRSRQIRSLPRMRRECRAGRLVSAHRGPVERLQSAIRPDERFPIIIADPPYLRSADVNRWPGDPVTAIGGGLDGLDLIRACLQVAARCLEQGRHLLLQVHGSGQAEQLGALQGLRRRDMRVVDDERAVLLLDRPGTLARRRVAGSTTV